MVVLADEDVRADPLGDVGHELLCKDLVGDGQGLGFEAVGVTEGLGELLNSLGLDAAGAVGVPQQQVRVLGARRQGEQQGGEDRTENVITVRARFRVGLASEPGRCG